MRLEAALLEQKVRAEDLQKENAQLKRENNQLKRMPLFVAVIIDILENNEIYLRQQGNNQEYLTHASEEAPAPVETRDKSCGEQCAFHCQSDWKCV